MYLHVGKGHVVSTDSVVGVFDLDITSQSHLTRKYLRRAETEGQVLNAAEDIPKSFVVCAQNGKNCVILSQMATSTLLKRAESGKI